MPITPIPDVGTARKLLEDAKFVADPIQRGDKIYWFTLEELKDAADKARAVFAFAQERLHDEPHLYEHVDGDLLIAGGYLLAILQELSTRPEYRGDATMREALIEEQARVAEQRMAIVDRMLAEAGI